MNDKAIRVLLIEDSATYTELIRDRLSRAQNPSFVVDCQSRLSAGLERLAQAGADVVLLDLTLPDSAGLDTLVAVHAACSDIPIVVLTGLDDESVGVRAVDEGAQDYLVKGHFDGYLLTRALRYAIERHRVVAELLRLDAARSEFVANAAHELRSPVTALSGLAHTLASRRNEMTEERINDFFGMIEAQSRRMLDLVRDLLDLSQIEHGLRVAVRPVDVAKACADAVASTPPPPGTVVDVEAEDVVALADPLRLEQVLVNLLINAYRYGGRKIVVRAAASGADAVLTVADDGEGVVEELVPSLFDPFTRGATKGRRVDGSGLGLAIARKLVEAMGGQIAYEPNIPHGASFRVVLKRND